MSPYLFSMRRIWLTSIFNTTELHVWNHWLNRTSNFQYLRQEITTIQANSWNIWPESFYKINLVNSDWIHQMNINAKSVFQTNWFPYSKFNQHDYLYSTFHILGLLSVKKYNKKWLRDFQRIKISGWTFSSVNCLIDLINLTIAIQLDYLLFQVLLVNWFFFIDHELYDINGRLIKEELDRRQKLLKSFTYFIDFLFLH